MINAFLTPKGKRPKRAVCRVPIFEGLVFEPVRQCKKVPLKHKNKNKITL